MRDLGGFCGVARFIGGVPAQTIDLGKVMKGELTGKFFSPASILTLNRFSGGGKGHDHISLYPQYG